MSNQVYQKLNSDSTEYLVYSYVCNAYFTVAVSSECIVVRNDNEFTAILAAPEGWAYILHEAKNTDHLLSLVCIVNHKPENDPEDNDIKDYLTEVLIVLADEKIGGGEK